MIKLLKRLHEYLNPTTSKWEYSFYYEVLLGFNKDFLCNKYVDVICYKNFNSDRPNILCNSIFVTIGTDLSLSDVLGLLNVGEIQRSCVQETR
jgi:hypothetical protein